MSKNKWKQKAKKLKAKFKKLEKKYDKSMKVLAKAQQESLYDELTSLPNRRYFNLYLTQQWSNCQREQLSLGLLLCDVDNFKLYNDYFGHQKGDECLAKVANALSRGVRRKHDFVARFGGEEFAVILPNIKLSGTNQVAQNILQSVRNLNEVSAKSQDNFSITLSIGGIIVTPTKEGAIERSIYFADSALYLAKKLGKDRAIIQENSLWEIISNPKPIETVNREDKNRYITVSDKISSQLY